MYVVLEVRDERREKNERLVDFCVRNGGGER